MREPEFWYRPPSLTSLLLSPFGALYGMISGRRMLGAGLETGTPVFCIGNYHLGGAGKTPMVLVLTKLLRDLGETPVVLSRGYGGRLHGPIMVDPVSHEAADVGDEPIMLSGTVPVIVSRDRVNGVALARARNASVILMDDGFQNPVIAKDASLIVIDAERGLGNGKVFPAGPLRAPLLPQIVCTDALVVIGDGSAAKDVASAVAAHGRPVLSAQIKVHEPSLAGLRGKRVFAFAGIGDPGRFFKTLRGCGIEVAVERPFPDHYPFSKNDIAGLIAEARRDSLTLVTTEKDMVRLRKIAAAKEIVPFAVTLEFEELSRLRTFVADRLFQARAKKIRYSS
jgi:tetraacyldisaccharide 4'-kinase